MKKLILLIISSLFFMNCGFEIIDTGHRGIKTRFGKVQGETLDEGIHFYNPFTSDIQEMEVRTKKIELKTSCYTNDVQIAQIRAVLNYNLDPRNVHLVYQNVGKDWENRVLPQAIEGGTKEIIGKWSAENLVGSRENARKEAEEIIKKTLKENHVIVTKFQITNIDYQDQFETSVENKVVAIQNAIGAKNKTVQVEEEAKQRIIKAKAEAKSMEIRAQALSQNKNLVEYEAVQKWNGIMPTYMMGNTVPFLNLGK